MQPPIAADAPPVPRAVLGVVFMTLFLDLVGFGIILPVLPFYAVSFGASAGTVTLLSATYSAAQFVMSPVLGQVSDRYGRRRVMLISITGTCLAMLVLGFADSLWLVFVARLISGVSGANISTAQAIVADRVAPAERAKYMGMMGAAIGLGFVFGPAIGGMLWSEDAPARPFLLSSALGAVNLVLAWRFLPRDEVRRDRLGAAPFRGPIARLVGVAKGGAPGLRVLILSYFVFNLAFSAMESTFALLIHARLGWGERQTGALFTEIGIVIIVVQGLVVGRLVRGLGEKWTLVLGLLVLGLGLTVTGTAHAPLSIALGSGVIAAGNGLVAPSLSALVSRASGADEQGFKLGVAASASSLARVVGPTCAGLLFELAGPGVPMQAGAAVVGMLAVVATWAVVAPASREPRPSVQESP